LIVWDGISAPELKQTGSKKFSFGMLKIMFVRAGAFGKASWWLVEKLADGILMLAFVIYILLLCTPKARKMTLGEFFSF
jgi:hypothetical protein